MYSHLAIFTSPSTPSWHSLYAYPRKPSGQPAGEISPSPTDGYSPIAGHEPVLDDLQNCSMYAFVTN